MKRLPIPLLAPVAVCTSLLLMQPAVPAASAQWSAVMDPSPSDDIKTFLSAPEALYAGSFEGRVYASVDHGSTWNEIAGGLPSGYLPVVGMAKTDEWFLMSRSIPDEFDRHTFRSRLVGGEWTPWEAIPFQEGEIRVFATIGETIFALLEYTALHRSDDGGATWDPVPIPGIDGVGEIFAIDGRLFASENIINAGQIYRSDDLGATWAPVGDGLGSSYICSYTKWHDRVLLCVYHMGANGSVWSSTNYGDAWQRIDTLPTPYNINGMAATDDGRLAFGASGTNPAGESIWLTTDLIQWEDFTGNLPQSSRPVNSLFAHDGWLFKTGGSVTPYRAEQPFAASSEDDAPASAIALSARPVPFRSETRIRYALPAEGAVDLGVFDLSGRRVATLASGRVGAGNHEVGWTARDAAGQDVSGGVYFIRLSTEADARTIRVVHLP